MRRLAVILSALVISFLSSAAYGQEVRVEQDLLEQKEVPASAYYAQQVSLSKESASHDKL